MALSNYLEDALVDGTLRNTAYTPVATVYVALFTTDPTDADTGTELAGDGYTRISSTFDAPSNGATANSAEIAFPQATASWGTITHVGVYDATTAGNLLYHGVLTASKLVDINDTFKIAIGDLDITLD